MNSNSDSRLVLLHNKDSIFVCGGSITAGETIMMDGDAITLVENIEIGHKLARHDIEANQKILKYGVSVGSAKSHIQRGEHIHMHNMKSDYIPSHTRSGQNSNTVPTVEIKS